MVNPTRAHLDFVYRVQDRHPNISVVSLYQGSDLPINVLCENCGVPETKRRAQSLLRANGGCSNCARRAKTLRRTWRLKTYMLGRREVKVVGYEPQALDYIRQVWKIRPSDIRVDLMDPIPVIEYTHLRRQRKHYPDLWVPRRNLLLEVKSEYTAKTRRGNLRPMMLAKMRAAKAAGYDYRILIMNRDGSIKETLD